MIREGLVKRLFSNIYYHSKSFFNKCLPEEYDADALVVKNVVVLEGLVKNSFSNTRLQEEYNSEKW